VWATDSSADALDVARANLSGIAGFAATRVRLVEGHWWSALPSELRGSLDLVVSNPPYISSSEMEGLDAQVLDWEPHLALESGPSGLEAVHEILASARQWLRGEGVAVIEIAPQQARAARQLAYGSGFGEVEIYSDLAGRNRVLVARGQI
jgi:release factor glutamine methyltransferase